MCVYFRFVKEQWDNFRFVKEQWDNSYSTARSKEGLSPDHCYAAVLWYVTQILHLLTP